MKKFFKKDLKELFTGTATAIVGPPVAAFSSVSDEVVSVFDVDEEERAAYEQMRRHQHKEMIRNQIRAE